AWAQVRTPRGGTARPTATARTGSPSERRGRGTVAIPPASLGHEAGGQLLAFEGTGQHGVEGGNNSPLGSPKRDPKQRKGGLILVTAFPFVNVFTIFFRADLRQPMSGPAGEIYPGWHFLPRPGRGWTVSALRRRKFGAAK